MMMKVLLITAVLLALIVSPVWGQKSCSSKTCGSVSGVTWCTYSACGGSGGTAWNDGGYVSSTSNYVGFIQANYGAYVNGWLDTVMPLGNSLGCIGGWGGDNDVSQNIVEGDYWAALTVNYGSYVNGITLQSSLGTYLTMGAFGGPNTQVFAIPACESIAYFFGAAGSYLDSIGVVTVQWNCTDQGM